MTARRRGGAAVREIRDWAPDCGFKDGLGGCRSPDGCHCREIKALQERVQMLEIELAAYREGAPGHKGRSRAG